MKQYKGAVLFVDMLGVGALTKGLLRLDESSYEAWGIKKGIEDRHHVLAAKLLMGFRKSLLAIKKTREDVKIAQLSDCAFIWGKDVLAVVDTARALMWKLSHVGILCRGGLAYGNIVEPDKVNRSLGEFILGDAVTKAVDLEGSGKGARIFCDTEVARATLKKVAFKQAPFVGLKNPLDGSVVDEFRWFILPEEIGRHSYIEDRSRSTAGALVELLAGLRHSTWYNWNCSSQAGALQIACSIETISKSMQEFLPDFDLGYSVENFLFAPPPRSIIARDRYLKEVLNAFPPMKAKRGR